jgi:hypothetical protein
MQEHEDDGPPIDPAEAEYYDRLRAVVRPAGFKIDVRHGQEGPDHDPYGWTVYDIRMADGSRVLYRDALLSECLTIELPGSDVLRFTSPEYDGPITMERMFEDAIGFSIEQVRYWENEEWHRYSDIRDAEEAAGWDASP